VHYLAYLAWPVAFVHAIRAASYDQHLWWVALAEWGSLTAVATAVLVRLIRRGAPGARGSPDAPGAPSPVPTNSDTDASRRLQHSARP
jgi:hypothetical protein